MICTKSSRIPPISLEGFGKPQFFFSFVPLCISPAFLGKMGAGENQKIYPVRPRPTSRHTFFSLSLYSKNFGILRWYGMGWGGVILHLICVVAYVSWFFWGVGIHPPSGEAGREEIFLMLFSFYVLYSMQAMGRAAASDGFFFFFFFWNSYLGLRGDPTSFSRRGKASCPWLAACLLAPDS
jgi:hypothetical protein